MISFIGFVHVCMELGVWEREIEQLKKAVYIMGLGLIGLLLYIGVLCIGS
tara:strand:- start:321 stop:470 length:150 start_codon:yes stop_codon:yes gene_type:complete